MTGPADARRAVVLGRAVQIASVKGLEGLTLSRLSRDAGVPTSALQSLFGTKEQLQSAIVARAVDVFDREVPQVTERQPDGLPRVRRLMDAWIDYLPTQANHDRKLLARGDALDRGRRALAGLLAAAGASQR